MSVNTGRPILSGQLVSRYHGPSRPLTTARFVVMASTCSQYNIYISTV